MKIVEMGRGEGKTQRLLDWVNEGERCDPYPSWTRIIITFSLNEAQRLRNLLLKPSNREDSLQYNKVYAYEEWKTALIPFRWEGEIAIDNLDLLLEGLIDWHAPIRLATITTEENARDRSQRPHRPGAAPR